MPEQKSNAKKSLLPAALREPLLALGDDAKALAARAMRRLFGVTQSWERFRDIARNNYDLGCEHLARANLKDAILRFKFVLWMNPKHAEAWYHLGCAYLAQGNKPLARHALSQALKWEPQREETAYMLAVAGGRNMNDAALPRRIPPSLLLEHFDRLAPDYARQQLEESQYRGHRLLCDAVRAVLTPGRMDHVILDLGAGTGFCGPLLRDVAAHITGVDLSGAMLAEAMKLQDAQGKKIYDALIKRDLQEFLGDVADGAFDIVLAAGVANYIGDLHPLFAQVSRVLKSGGIFALTADRLTGGNEQEFRFDTETAQFRYSGAYLHTLAQMNVMHAVHFGEAETYPDFVAWLCVFAKS